MTENLDHQPNDSNAETASEASTADLGVAASEASAVASEVAADAVEAHSGEVAASTEAGENAADAGESAKKRWRWTRNRFIALGAAILLLGGGGAWAYSAYQAPETVIGMAVGSLFSNQNPSYDVKVSASGASLSGISGDLTLSVSSSSVGTDLNTLLNLDLAGQKASANLEAIGSKQGDLYFQLSKFDSLVSVLKASGIPASTVDAISTAVSDKWVKVTKAEIDQLAGTSGSSATCIQDKFKDASHAEAVKNEMIDLAKNHEFMVVSKELGTSNGSVGYEMAFDTPQLKAFLIGFLDSKLFADYQECSGSSASFSKADAAKAINSISGADLQTALKGTTISIWADQWSHKLTKLSVVTEQPTLTLKVELTPAGDRSSQVKIPTDTISITELETSLLMSGSASSGL